MGRDGARSIAASTSPILEQESAVSPVVAGTSQSVSEGQVRGKTTSDTSYRAPGLTAGSFDGESYRSHVGGTRDDKRVEGEIVRMPAHERRQRVAEIERELIALREMCQLEKMEEWCRETDRLGAPLLNPLEYEDRAAFEEWIRGMESSMRQTERVDYFGPFLVAVGRRVEKRWGVIFTCLTTRAVHLEIAHSLNTALCIMAIRRFIARRGSPLEIISDRGTNFVGASRELDEALKLVDHEKLMVEFCGPNLKWTFNPPGAPHFGGCWERLVRSVKTVLGKLDLPRRPTDEVLGSTFTEIELILNSRPLTYVPLDNEMSGPITQNHLLLGSSNGSKPPIPPCEGPAAVQSGWKAAQLNADIFWRKWVAEYLPTLTRRTKWFQPVQPIQEGDVVIVVDNTLPRNSWPKGRVTSVVHAKDGQVRQATVDTGCGTYVRPAHKIADLDLEKEIVLTTKPQTVLRE
uniref:uncharacterized protein LOC125907321 n=1 Tax=Anopheles coluzzii TaxID=1518534 RepID=UPI0020FFA19E|nr:uncharacterized protein LOC125907321 [Anopheles coluzzii]